MPPVDVRVTNVVDLEAERVLQAVARLFLGQAGHDDSPLGDIYNHKTAGFCQHTGNLVNPISSRYTVRASAEVELSKRADVVVSQAPEE